MKKFLAAAGLLAMVFGVRGLSLAEEGHQHQGKTEVMGASCPMGGGATMNKSCPTEMEKCCPVMVKGAEVAIEKIPEGVIMKVTAKDAKVVAEIQATAEKMKECKQGMKSGKMDKTMKEEGNKEEIVTCPVMGTKMKKSKAFDKTEYKGKTYYFCCGECKPEFLKNPEKYAK